MAAGSAGDARTARRGSWLGDLLGAVNATAAMLPFAISYGFISFAVLGAAGARHGLAASLIAVVVGGLVMVAVGRSRLPAGSPSASTCLIVGNALSGIARDGAVDTTAAHGVAVLLCAAGAIVVLGGLLTMALGAARAGHLARFVPRPVLAGLMDGVAVLIVFSQLPALLGVAGGSLAPTGASGIASWHGPAVVAGLATAVGMTLASLRWPRAPAPALAMIIAGIAAWAWSRLAQGGAAAAPLETIGPLALSWPWADATVAQLDAPLRAELVRHAPKIVLAAVLVAVVGALETVLNLAAVQQSVGEPGDPPADPNRELAAAGSASVVGGLLGGMPVVYMRTRALATRMGGGHGARSLSLGCVLMALVAAVGLVPLESLSRAVVAGVVIALALRLVDPWTIDATARWWRGEHRAVLNASLGVALAVAAATVIGGVAAGVGLGVMVSVVVFMRTLHRQLVRARYDATVLASRRVYPAADEALLGTERARIRIVELEGALFFGSADRLAGEAEAVPAGTRDVVFDLRRLTAIDATGALAVAQAGERLAARGIVVRLSSLKPGDRHERVLRAHGVELADGDAASADPAGGDASRAPPSALRTHADLDRAIEAAERAALARAGRHDGARRLDLASSRLLEGLLPAERDRVLPRFVERRLAAGQRLFAQGDPGDALYVLSEGAVSVVDADTGQRFATFPPGMCFGETAMLDGAPRTADAIADVDSVVHALGLDEFERLHISEPSIAARMDRNLARHLSERLRAAAVGWRHAAE